MPPEARHWRPAPGEWSAHEVVCHTADSETNAYARIRFLVAEDDPVIQGYDQEHWVSALDYPALSAESAMAAVEAVRGHTAALIRRLPEAAWRRAGTHSESGPYSGDDWLRIYSAHLEDHARQIEENVASFRRGPRAATARASMVRTGAQYIASLRDGRTVYVNGERVAEATFLAGITLRIAESIGVGKAPQTQTMLGELASYEATYHQTMLTYLRELAGGGLLQVPSSVQGLSQPGDRRRPRALRPLARAQVGGADEALQARVGPGRLRVRRAAPAVRALLRGGAGADDRRARLPRLRLRRARAMVERCLAGYDCRRAPRGARLRAG